MGARAALSPARTPKVFSRQVRHDTVKKLSAYCEIVFLLVQKVSKGGSRSGRGGVAVSKIGQQFRQGRGSSQQTQ